MRTATRTTPLHRIAVPVLTALILSVSNLSFADTFVSVAIAPPLLPVYTQPTLPGPGYIWTPGYWAYGAEGYYWVPGTWVLAPSRGALWTPGYWAWRSGFYVWNAGYWGPRIGFYGGVNYGFGYFGVGYQGGYWNNGAFYYNRAASNINVTYIHNSYNTSVIRNKATNRVSYNGGTGGLAARPSARERAADAEPHTPPTALQQQHQQGAAANRKLLASVNHGRPSIAATPEPGKFDQPGVVAAKARSVGPRSAPAMRADSAPRHGPASRGNGPSPMPGSHHASGENRHSASPPHSRHSGAEGYGEAPPARQ